MHGLRRVAAAGSDDNVEAAQILSDTAGSMRWVSERGKVSVESGREEVVEAWGWPLTDAYMYHQCTQVLSAANHMDARYVTYA